MAGDFCLSVQEWRMENERGDSAFFIYSFVLCDTMGKCALNLCTDFILCAHEYLYLRFNGLVV